jgi:hypothetical protein
MNSTAEPKNPHHHNTINKKQIATTTQPCPPTCKHQLNIQRRIFLAVLVVIVPASCALLCAGCIAQCECCAERLAQGACLEASQCTGITGWRLQESFRNVAGIRTSESDSRLAAHRGASVNMSAHGSVLKRASAQASLAGACRKVAGKSQESSSQFWFVTHRRRF